MNQLDDILSTDEAATLLKMHRATLMRKAKSCIIPGAKPGKSWIFVRKDLLEWIAAEYHKKQQVSQVVGLEKDLCPSRNVAKHGVSISRLPMEKEYEYLLGLK